MYIISTLNSPNPKSHFIRLVISRYIRVSTDLDVVDTMDFTEDNRYLVCALLGSKEIAIYRLSMEGGTLYKHFPIGAALTAG